MQRMYGYVQQIPIFIQNSHGFLGLPLNNNPLQTYVFAHPVVYVGNVVPNLQILQGF